jgi:hypothetical protein
MSTASEVTDTIADMTKATITEAGEFAQDQYDSVVALIRRNPLQAAAIAAAIGFAFAALARRQ